MADISEAIRLYREKKGWSQAKMAEVCGINAVQLRKYESGTNRPGATVMSRIVAACPDFDLEQALAGKPLWGYHRQPKGESKERTFDCAICTQCDWGATISLVVEAGQQVNFCPVCGSKAISQCPDCGHPFSFGVEVFCSQCGVRLRPGPDQAGELKPPSLKKPGKS